MEAPAQTLLTAPPAPLPRWLLVLGSALVIAAIVFGSWYLTGPAPAPATKPGSTASKRFPPLVLADSERPGSELSRAAADLASGATDDATKAFTKLAVANPDAVEPQVGLILARWRSTGPAAVIGDLTQVAREHPADGWVRLELGLSRVLAGDGPAATTATDDLQAAQRLALSARRFDVARHADDLLHPGLLPGYPPTVVGPADVHDAARSAIVARITNQLTQGDRAGAAAVAAGADARAAAIADPLVAAAVAAATFTKARPLEADALLAKALIRDPGNDALRFQRALVLIWSGDPTRGRQLLAQVAARGRVSDRWRRDAALIAAKLG